MKNLFLLALFLFTRAIVFAQSPEDLYYNIRIKGNLPGKYIQRESISLDKFDPNVLNTITSVSQRTAFVNTVTDLANTSGVVYPTIVVKDSVRGGRFTYYQNGYIVDNGMVFQAPNGGFYVRQTDEVYLNYFADVNTTDWTTAFTNAQNYIINKSNNNRGGILNIKTGIYNISGITIQSRITLKGTGRGICILRLINSSNKDVVTIPKTSIQVTIKDITIDGNKSNNTSGNGIYIEGVGDADGHNQNQLWDKSVNAPSSYSYHRLENVTISQCAENGINIPGVVAGGANYAMIWNNIITEYNNQNGIFNKSTDNLFSDIYTEKNGLYGINEAGSNNKWTNIKTIWNCQTLNRNSGGGIKAGGNRNSFVQVEAQDNFSHGYVDIGIDNMFTNCLADGNGYISQGNLTSNRATYGFYINNANGSRFSNCKSTNYRGVQLDGFYIQEKGFYIESQSQNIGTPDISVNYKHNTPSIPETDSPTIPQAELISYRSTTATVGSTTFTIGEPAITNAGLTITDQDKIIVPNTINISNTFSVVTDFVYQSGASSVTSPRILISDNGVLDIKFATSNSVDYIYFIIKTGGGTTRTCQSVITPIAGTAYRITLRVKTVGNLMRMQGYISQLDANGPVSLIYAVTSITLNTGETIDPIRNIAINSQTDKLTAVYEKFLITSEFVNDANLYYGGSLQKIIPNSILYTNFATYQRPTSLFFYGSFPPASAYYRGINLIQRNDGNYSDRKVICIRRFDGTYVWFIENAQNQYYFQRPTTGSWDNGNVVWNSSPTTTGPIGWRVLTGGSSPTWQDLYATPLLRTLAVTPTTTDIPLGTAPQLIKVTADGSVKWYINDAGTIKAGSAFN